MEDAGLREARLLVGGLGDCERQACQLDDWEMPDCERQDCQLDDWEIARGKLASWRTGRRRIALGRPAS